MFRIVSDSKGYGEDLALWMNEQLADRANDKASFEKALEQIGDDAKKYRLEIITVKS